MKSDFSLVRKCIIAAMESKTLGGLFERLYDLKQKYAKRFSFDAPLASPPFLSFEVSSICNANCIFCAYQFLQRKKEIMSFDLFKKMLDQYVGIGGGSVGFTPVVGEPLIDAALEKKIAYARSFPEIKSIHITTNAILLARQRFESLVNAGLTHFVISISGLNADEYKRLYRVAAYPRVIANLVDIAHSPMFSRVTMLVSIRTDSFFHQFQPDYIRLKKLGYQLKRMLFFSSWSGKITNDHLRGWMFIRPRRKMHVPCQALFNELKIYPDGAISACGCQDLEGNGELCLGSAYHTTIGEVWQSDKLKLLRQRFLTGNRPDICVDCRHYIPAY